MADQSHDPVAYHQWLAKKATGTRVQFDTTNAAAVRAARRVVSIAG